MGLLSIQNIPDVHAGDLSLLQDENFYLIHISASVSKNSFDSGII